MHASIPLSRDARSGTRCWNRFCSCLCLCLELILVEHSRIGWMRYLTEMYTLIKSDTFHITWYICVHFVIWNGYSDINSQDTWFDNFMSECKREIQDYILKIGYAVKLCNIILLLFCNQRVVIWILNVCKLQLSTKTYIYITSKYLYIATFSESFSNVRISYSFKIC